MKWPRNCPVRAAVSLRLRRIASHTSGGRPSWREGAELVRRTGMPDATTRRFHMLRIPMAGASALAFIAFTGVASAADVQRIPPPPRATVLPAATIPNGWAGHYVGLVGGY